LVHWSFGIVVVVGACSGSGSPRSTAATPATSTTRRDRRPMPTGPAPAAAEADGVVFHGRRDRPLVALTFDSNLTPAMVRELDHHQVVSFDNRAVIDELDQLHVPATFFLAGLWVERYPDEARRLAADPLFELASHSYAHRAFAPHCYDLGPPLAVDQMAPDIERSEALLHHFNGRVTPYFRFPGGCYTAAAVAAARTAGVVVIQYDLASGDAFGHSVNAIVRTVLSGVHNGSIVVMHVTGGNTAPLTDKALPAIVAGLRAKGFVLVRVSELLAAAAA
jgi:peptidoglycan/xylan/chitin deacetylase (PgdA/CDA1 family)